MTSPCLRRDLPCGCCEGVSQTTPLPVANRPGLDALSYRVGTHPTFFQSMEAQLSSLRLELPTGKFDENGVPKTAVSNPLAGLTTRDRSDFSIALLDGWATVADLLTFYQERIANEGYLRTATERRSVLELARLVGYTLRPGVSASVYLAYTLDDNQTDPTTVAAGARAQSLPGPGETPQSFETSEDLLARREWNNPKPRMTRPQRITPENAETIDALYLDGVTTKLKPNDPLLFVFGDGEGLQVLRWVETVSEDQTNKRTRITLRTLLTKRSFPTALREAVTRRLEEMECLGSGNETGNAALKLLLCVNDYLTNLDSPKDVAPASDKPPCAKLSDKELAQKITGALPSLRAQHVRVVRALDVPLANWIANVAREFDGIIRNLTNDFWKTDDFWNEGSPPARQDYLGELPDNVRLSPLSGLSAMIPALSKPPALNPANSARLRRDASLVTQSRSDVAPRMLTALLPQLNAPDVYKAWSNAETRQRRPVEIHAVRLLAQPFGCNAPTKPGDVGLTANDDTNTPNEHDNEIYLDGGYDGILAESWVVVDLSDVSADNRFRQKDTNELPIDIIITKAISQGTQASRADYRISGKLTRVKLKEPWGTFENPPAGNTTVDFEIIRRTRVYARSERLTLADAPVTAPVCGDAIELDGLYNGLELGRWIIVSGERADMPLKTTGVQAAELVMLAGVRQGGARKKGCDPLPPDGALFSKIEYVTDPNAVGDRLVVGSLSEAGEAYFNEKNYPAYPDQRYCEPVELAKGVFSELYVPTALERKGRFPSFAGLLLSPGIDPSNDPPTPCDSSNVSRCWAGCAAVRIPPQAMASTLLLASPLAYVYKRDTITIHGNVVQATHGETRNEVLGSGDGARALQEFTLRQSPLTYVSAPTPAGAASTLQVQVNGVFWREVESLDALKPTDHKFITRTDEQGKTKVIFGDGVHGSRLPQGLENVSAAYRTGIGETGNVKAGQIKLLSTRPLGVKAVINPLLASGGAGPESRDQARRNAPLAVMALDRLVSVKDYEDFARTFAGVGKASAAKLSDGHQEVVHLTIAGANDIPIDEASSLYENLGAALLKFGDPQLPIRAAMRELMLLVIACKVRRSPDYPWDTVASGVRAALLDAFSFERRELGQNVYLSEVIGVIQRVPGVEYVDLDMLDSVSETDATTRLEERLKELAASSQSAIPKTFVAAHKAQYFSKTDNSSVVTEGVAPAQLAYLSPKAPDTLILTEALA